MSFTDYFKMVAGLFGDLFSLEIVTDSLFGQSSLTLGAIFIGGIIISVLYYYLIPTPTFIQSKDLNDEGKTVITTRFGFRNRFMNITRGRTKKSD